MDQVEESQDRPTRRQPEHGARWGLRETSFVIFMLCLMGLFVTLGTWQLARLGEKEALLATVQARFNLDAQPFPSSSAWTDLDTADLDYGRYEVTGTFVGQDTVLVFTNLVNPVGLYGGVGYWVMVPLMLDDGSIVWINRGFVPEAAADEFLTGEDVPTGRVVLEGIARRSELANSFTPEPNFDERRAWLRNPERLTAFLSEPTTRVAPVTIDALGGEPGDLPQGGETQITFPNRHLEYVGTWYLFAAITPVMLGFWLWRQRRPGNLAHEGKDN